MKTRFLSIVMVAMLSCATFAGQSVTSAFTQVETTDVEEDPIYDVLVSRSDVELTLTNDATYPWTIDVNEGALKNGNCGVANSASSFTLSFKSEYKTGISFDWHSYNYSSHRPLEVFVDGVSKGTTSSSSYHTMRFYLEPGEHIIMFKDSIGNYSSTSNYSYIKNLFIKEITPLEDAVLTEDSKSITFKNDSDYPWTIEDGYIQNGSYGTAYSSSRFSTTFTIERTSKLSYEVAIPSYDYYYDYTYNSNGVRTSYHDLYVNINGRQWDYWQAERDWTTDKIILEPGTYTVEFLDTIRNTTSNYFARLRNIELTSNWIEVEVATAGTLGVEVLYKVNVLNDVEMLKVKGPLNATDWTNIKQMKNLYAIDLSEATFEALPNNAFDGMTWIGSVILPEGMKTIGNYAFNGTRIININIPSTVTSIGSFSFANTRLTKISFNDNSQLKTISDAAFYNCTRLENIIMPNTVTSVGYAAFQNCTSLKSLIFSDALTTILEGTCYECTSLQNIHLPINLQDIRHASFYNTPNLSKVNLPSTVNRIYNNAFYNCGLDSLLLPVTMQYLYNDAFKECKKLKYIELPSYLESNSTYEYIYYYGINNNALSRYSTSAYYGYYHNFENCPAIETIVMRSATPPAIINDPLSNARAKSTITLKVPAFAVANYKLDTYWYQFGNIEEIDVELDYWKIAGDLSLTNNRRMGGKPDLDLYFGGKMTVGGNAPMETANFNWFVNESNPGCLLNNCTSVSADSLNTYYTVEKNKWYFFTPAHDVDLTKVSHSANASYVFRYYDAESRATNGTGNSWRNVDTDKLIAGQGYIFHCDAAGTVTMPAEATSHVQIFNVGDVTQTLNVYESTASANKNWNYVGNPYPTYYDIYYMDFTAPITVWTGSTYKAYSIADDNFVLRPMQSFFVQKPDEVDKIVFHKEGRQLTSAIARPSYAKTKTGDKPSETRLFFDLQITSDEEEMDETRIVINDGAQMAYELESDASKFMSMKEDVPQLFSIDKDGNSYAINERPISDGLVNLGYRVSDAGYYTISAIRTDGEISLYDNKTNKTIDLTSQDYYFYSEATEGTENTRFTLKLNAGISAPTDVNAVNRQDVSVIGADGCINVSCVRPSSVYVYATDGRVVYENIQTIGDARIAVPEGIYIVKVNNSTFRTIVF